MSDPQAPILLSHRYQSPPERVFEAWLDPLAVADWMSGPTASGQDSVPSHFEVDAREGGRFSFVVLREGVAYAHEGEYLRVAPPDALDFTWGLPAFGPDFCTLRLRFAREGGGTLLRLEAEGVPEAFRERTQAGWAHLLGAIATRALGEAPDVR